MKMCAVVDNALTSCPTTLALFHDAGSAWDWLCSQRRSWNKNHLAFAIEDGNMTVKYVDVVVGL